MKIRPKFSFKVSPNLTRGQAHLWHIKSYFLFSTVDCTRHVRCSNKILCFMTLSPPKCLKGPELWPSMTTFVHILLSYHVFSKCMNLLLTVIREELWTNRLWEWCISSSRVLLMIWKLFFLFLSQKRLASHLLLFSHLHKTRLITCSQICPSLLNV